MKFIISASTDIGKRKQANQDSLFVRTFLTKYGRIAFAVLCDGMGGYSKGEVASAVLIRAFSSWIMEKSNFLFCNKIDEMEIKKQWTKLIDRENKKIKDYGNRHRISIGTTITALLLTKTRYYIVNVGDTRVYEVTDSILQITNDHSFVQREVDFGYLTPEEALNHPKSHLLLQCVGNSDEVKPEMHYGDCKQNAIYMLCSDGFRRKISESEILQSFAPSVLTEADLMKQNEERMIELNKLRGETDNISVITIRTIPS